MAITTLGGTTRLEMYLAQTRADAASFAKFEDVDFPPTVLSPQAAHL